MQTTTTSSTTHEITKSAKGGVIEGVSYDAAKSGAELLFGDNWQTKTIRGLVALLGIGGVSMTTFLKLLISKWPIAISGGVAFATFLFIIWSGMRRRRPVVDDVSPLRPPQEITAHVERIEAKEQELEEHKKTIAALNEKIDAEANKATKEIAWRQQELNRVHSMLLSGRNARALIEVRDRIRNTQVGLSRVTEWLEELVKKPSGDDRIMREVRSELLGALSNMPIKACLDLGLVHVKTHLENSTNEYLKSIHPYLPELGLDDIKTKLLPPIRIISLSMEIARQTMFGFLDNAIVIRDEVNG